MRINFKDVLDSVSIKTGISKKNITFDAFFQPANVDVGKYYDDHLAKKICLSEFKRNLSSGLIVNIYANEYEVLRFSAQDIEPYTKEIYNLMRVSCINSCVGPGFYSYHPYLILDKHCDQKNIEKFIETISFDPDKTKVDFCPDSGKNQWGLKNEHKEFLQNLPANAISKTFFKDIESDLARESE